MTDRDSPGCRWTEDEYGIWATACGELFQFIDDGPNENRVKYCCYCGRSVIVVPYVEPEDTDE